MNIADQLRAIIGQETTPPLWIYVTKNQIPVLERAAVELDAMHDKLQQAFADGVVVAARAQECRHGDVKKLFAKYT